MSIQELMGRAKRDTRWFSLKADICPGTFVALAIALGTYVQQHGGEHFKMRDITVPLIAGLVALLGYWIVVNGAEFTWNLAQAGNRITIEQLRSHPAKPHDPVEETIQYLDEEGLSTRFIEEYPKMRGGSPADYFHQALPRYRTQGLVGIRSQPQPGGRFVEFADPTPKGTDVYNRLRRRGSH